MFWNHSEDEETGTRNCPNWLVGKRVVDFLLVLIELFFRQLLRLRHYEQILVEIVLFEGGWVTLSANFRGRRGSSTNEFWRQKTRAPGVPGLSRGAVCVILSLAVLIQYRRVTDRQTDTRWWLLSAHCLRRAGKKQHLHCWNPEIAILYQRYFLQYQQRYRRYFYKTVTEALSVKRSQRWSILPTLLCQKCQNTRLFSVQSKFVI